MVGIVLLWYPYQEFRRQYWAASLDTLMASNLDGIVDVEIVHRPEEGCALPDADMQRLIAKFPLVVAEPQPVGTGGTDQTCAWGIEQLINRGNCDSFIFLTDDIIYSKDWFQQLTGLMARHPFAKAWSVYRSAHERHHKTLEVRDGDVLVKSISGNGTCMTVQEWKEWGIHWTQGQSWPSSEGDTLDLLHPIQRPGERWVTEKSYIEHIGAHGTRVVPGIPEHAQNFAGVD